MSLEKLRRKREERQRQAPLEYYATVQELIEDFNAELQRKANNLGLRHPVSVGIIEICDDCIDKAECDNSCWVYAHKMNEGDVEA